DSTQYQDALGATVQHICGIVPHGVLCFFPSYTLLEKVAARWESTGLLADMQKGKVVLQEPRGSDGFDNVMGDYNRAIARSIRLGAGGGGGALFLAVCRGKVEISQDPRAGLILGA
ncbi:hypothetical protein T484DRAFT_1767401, partial [Baffinella frigidus]